MNATVRMVMRVTDAALFSPITRGDVYGGACVRMSGYKPASTCQWPQGCGKDTLPGFSYCAEHKARAYDGIPPPKKRGGPMTFKGAWVK